MKSKTSCFNATIFKKNITHYWPIWLVYLGYLMAVLPINIWLRATTKTYYESMTAAARQYSIIGGVLSSAISPEPVFVFSAAAALAVFCYLYTAKNANMIHSLPVNRLELYVTNYLSGFLFLFVPEVIAFVSAVLVCLANQIVCIQHLFLWFLCIAGITFLAYSLAVFAAMFTGQIVAMPFYYLIMNFLYVGCLYLLNQVVSLLCYGISSTWNPGVSGILSPLYWLSENMRVESLYDDKTGQITGVAVSGGNYVTIYAAAAIVLTVLAYRLYKSRRIETAGDVVSIGVLKPILRWGLGLYGGMVFAAGVTALLQQYRQVNEYLGFLLCAVVFGFLCFFAAEMVLQKNFRVFRKKRVLEWAVFTAAMAVMVTLFRVDAFGIEKRVPAAEDIRCAFLNMDYPMEIEDEDVPAILALQRQCIEDKQQNLEAFREGKDYYYTTFRYYMKDGSVFERRYPVAVKETQLADETSVASRILSMEREPERLLTQLFGRGYEGNDYYSGYIDLYDERGNSDTYVFNEEEMEIVLGAIEADVWEGNFDSYQLLSIYGENEQAYMNGISFSYYNRDGFYDNWDYYYNYDSYQGGGEQAVAMSGAGTCYISFGPACENTIAALRQIGAVNDEWKLYTYSEYEKTQQAVEQ